VPPVRTPQVCSPPALTWVKVPARGVDWPLPSSPQQVTVPAVVTAHVWRSPALTWVKVPAGGVA